MNKPTPQPAARRGEIVVLIGGKPRILKFGMNTLSAFAQLHSDSPGDFAQQLEKNPIQALIEMTYCGLLVRKEGNELPDDFSPALVGDWIDEMEQGTWQVVVQTLTASMSLGNPTGGRTTPQ